MDNLRFIFRYIKYLLFSKTKHNIHSPYIYEFATKVLKSKTSNPGFKKIENIRTDLIKNKSFIEVTDFGAGSSKSNKRQVSKIAVSSSKSKKYAILLHKIINYYKPQVIVELGTSLGISTMYQYAANKSSDFTTIEGCPKILEIAEQNFKKINFQNIKTLNGNFDIILPKFVNELKTIDYVFFDGNHKKEPTLKYFNYFLSKINNETIFVFDDIHWSEEMEEAWNIIKTNDKVKVTIDLFFIGIVFFKKELAKQDFVIRY